MIPLDWKERLKFDTEDFVARKLPQGDYYIDIVYNAYPKRVDNKIPAEVIQFVAKVLASKIAKKADNYLPFYDYLWNDKGENGRQVFIHIMRPIVKKNPELFLGYLQKKLASCNESTDINSILRRAVAPLLTADGRKYIDILYGWLSIDNQILHKSLIDLLIKAAKDDSSLTKYIFQKMERSWIYPTQHTIKDSSTFLKAISKSDTDFYISVYDNYKNSRNPVFIEILSGSLVSIAEQGARERILEYFVNWSKSGNVRIKKAGQSGQRILKKRTK